MALLQPTVAGLYLDLGCGTGNYLRVMLDNGFRFYGIDPSETMLEAARRVCPEATLFQAYSENIPLENSFFDGAVVMFTMHHWKNQQQGINELARVLKPGSPVVFLSFTGKQMAGYWLNHYFPEMIKRSGELVPEADAMHVMLENAGFSDVQTENYFITNELQDHFLYSNKYRPEQYLDPEVRKAISSFAAFSIPDEVEKGLNQLQADIGSGDIHGIINQYENEMGDYLFYRAVKK